MGRLGAGSLAQKTSEKWGARRAVLEPSQQRLMQNQNPHPLSQKTRKKDGAPCHDSALAGGDGLAWTGVAAPQRTILGWKRVPATREAMESSSLWLLNTLTWGARERSRRFTGRPLRMRAADGWANGSHVDKFRLRALLAASFPSNPNFGLQYALDPAHDVIPLTHGSFDHIVAFLRGLPVTAAVAVPPPDSQSTIVLPVILMWFSEIGCIEIQETSWLNNDRAAGPVQGRNGRADSDSRTWARCLYGPAVRPCGTQELFRKFGAGTKLESSSFRGRAVQR